MPDYIKKMIPSAVILLIDAILFLLIPSQVKVLTDGLVTTLFMPYVVTGMIGLSAAVDLLQTFIKGRRAEAASTGKRYFSGKGFLRVVGAMAALAVYLMLMPTIGFVVDSVLLCVVTMLLLGNRNVKQILLVSVLLSFGVYCLFKLGLSLRLPAGFFFF